MEKLSLTPNLPPQKLSLAITTFTQSLSLTPPSALLQNFRHKIPSSNLSLYLDPALLEPLLKACLSFQLTPLIEGIGELAGTGTVRRLRDWYWRMSTDGGWRDEFEFERAIVLIVKIVGMFYRDGFGDVTVDWRLEAEVHVILVYIFMGMRVGIRTFQLLEKKYLINPTTPSSSQPQNPRLLKKQRKTFVKESNPLSKTNPKIRQSMSVSFFNQTQPMNMNININMNVTLSRLSKIRQTQLVKQDSNNCNSNYNSISNSISNSNSKTPIESFMDTLKEDLFVSPLPQIFKEKKRIQSFFMEAEKINNDSILSNTGMISQLDNSRQKQKKFPFLSTQLSISMHSQIIQRHVSIAQHTKPFKIHHKTPYTPKNTIIFKNPLNKTKDPNSSSNYNFNQTGFPTKMKEKQQEKWKLSCEEWRDTIMGIKQKFCRRDEKATHNLQDKRKYMEEEEDGNGLDISVSARVGASQGKKQQWKTTNLYQCLKQSTNIVKIENNSSIFPLSMAKMAAKKLKLQTSNPPNLITTPKPHQQSTQNIEPQNQTLECGIKNFKQVKVNQNQTYFQLEKLEKVHKNDLRQGQRKFDEEIKNRDARITYTMFMLPGMKNKIKKLAPL